MLRLVIALMLVINANIVYADSAIKLDINIDDYFEEQERIAATYPDDNTDLSVQAKYSIMTGKAINYEKMTIKAYVRYKDNPARKAYVSGFLYQLFLVFIDENNPDKDIKKSKTYLDKLEKEFFGSEEAKKARRIYAEKNT